MKNFLILFFVFYAQNSHAHPEIYYCKPENKKESAVRLFQYDYDLTRIRFVDLSPDRYFSGRGRQEQFATRETAKSSLELKKDKGSYVLFEHRVCGNLMFTWKQGDKKIRYSCENVDKNKKGCSSKK